MAKTPKKATPASTNPEEVNAYMRRLVHPYHAEIETIRQMILAANSKICERIKWNAPSFFYQAADMAAFNPRAKGFIQLVFVFPKGITEDPGGLFLGDWKDRREARFYDQADITAKRPALEKVVNAWVQRMDE